MDKNLRLDGPNEDAVVWFKEMFGLRPDQSFQDIPDDTPEEMENFKKRLEKYDKEQREWIANKLNK